MQNQEKVKNNRASNPRQPKHDKKSKKHKPTYRNGKDIVFDKPDNVVEILRAGTIEAIVEWLLDHIEIPDDEIKAGSGDGGTQTQELLDSQKRRQQKEEENLHTLQVFIISYRQFVSPTRFFSILEERWKTRDASQSRYAVVKMLTVWLGKYLNRDFFFHDKGNRLFDQLLEFINYMGKHEGKEIEDANRLKLLILRTRLLPNAINQRVLPAAKRGGNSQQSMDDPNKRFAFCEMPLVELAEQLTLIELDMFKSIREREFLNLNWKKAEKKRHSRHIVKMVERFNKVSFWVATRIVRERDIKRRTSLLKRFIILADKCRELNNFNTLMEVLAGLNLHPVQRLKQTWANLSEKYMETMNALEQLMESKKNYFNYRAKLSEIRTTGASTLPYLGVYLRDLTFVEEGNKTITDSGLINYEKIQMVGQVIKEVQYFQKNSNYDDLVPSDQPPTIKYLKKLKGLKEEQLDQKSLECEVQRPLGLASPSPTSVNQ
eukprot:TRINITY_DN6356_c0_g2_i2.p1 TRINITY_DN6356_c0_g2~~TRINITY_DN6356_c0_g2_i2.p1  ORF type:complete len:489 (-),score=102.42 TRINITY_DN6356_c0_g2_i2:55-1521(-)